MMHGHDLVAIREKLQITQVTMAERLELSVRALQSLESDSRSSRLRRIHELAISRIVIDYAIERKDPSLLGALRPDLQNLIMEDFAHLITVAAGLRKDTTGSTLKVVSQAA